MSISSKANGLYRHDLMTLTQQKHSTHRSFLPERFEKLVQKKYKIFFKISNSLLFIFVKITFHLENLAIRILKTLLNAVPLEIHIMDTNIYVLPVQMSFV